MLKPRKYKKLVTAYNKALKDFDAAGEIIDYVEINSAHLSIKISRTGEGWRKEEIEK